MHVIRFDLPGSGMVATRFRIGSRKGSYQHNNRCTSYRLPLCVKLDISMLINIFLYFDRLSEQAAKNHAVASTLCNEKSLCLYTQDQWPYYIRCVYSAGTGTAI